jgi:hypothetical protein
MVMIPSGWLGKFIYSRKGLYNWAVKACKEYADWTIVDIDGIMDGNPLVPT